MSVSVSNMTAERFREAYDELGLTQAQAARFLGVQGRTVRRWASGDNPVPIVVAMVLEIMIDQGLDPAEVYESATGESWD